MRALPRGNQHGSEQRGPTGEDEAVDRDDNCRALQIFELGMLDLAVNLRQALLAAHGQDRVAECHQNSEQPKQRNKFRSLEEPESVIAELEIRWRRQRWQVNSTHQQRIRAPDKQHHHHDRGDLHYAKSLVARLFDALDVLPPVIDGHSTRKYGCSGVHVELEWVSMHIVQRWWKPARMRCHDHQLVQKSRNVLSG